MPKGKLKVKIAGMKGLGACVKPSMLVTFQQVCHTLDFPGKALSTNEITFNVLGSDSNLWFSFLEESQIPGSTGIEVDLSDYDSRPVRGWLPLDYIFPNGQLFVGIIFESNDGGPDKFLDFQITGFLQTDHTGPVFKLRNKYTRESFVMQVISKEIVIQSTFYEDSKIPRRLRSITDSHFVAGLACTFESSAMVYSVTKCVAGRRISRYLERQGHFEEEHAKFYLAELLIAIEHLQILDVMCPDLPVNHVLLGDDGQIVVSNFGCFTSFATTPLFASLVGFYDVADCCEQTVAPICGGGWVS